MDPRFQSSAAIVSCFINACWNFNNERLLFPVIILIRGCKFLRLGRIKWKNIFSYHLIVFFKYIQELSFMPHQSTANTGRFHNILSCVIFSRYLQFLSYVLWLSSKYLLCHSCAKITYLFFFRRFWLHREISSQLDIYPWWLRGDSTVSVSGVDPLSPFCHWYFTLLLFFCTAFVFVFSGLTLCLFYHKLRG